MIDKEMPADWAIEKALKLREFDDGHCLCLDDVKKAPSIFVTAIAFARYIEAHETPPVSRELLCAREAAAREWPSSRAEIESGDWDGCGMIAATLSAIQLYASGFGEPNG